MVDWLDMGFNLVIGFVIFAVVFYSAWQVYTEDTEVVYSGSSNATNETPTSVVDTVHFSILNPITDLSGGEMIMYAVRYYNASGTEAFLFNSIEFTYFGYV